MKGSGKSRVWTRLVELKEELKEVSDSSINEDCGLDRERSPGTGTALIFDQQHHCMRSRLTRKMCVLEKDLQTMLY
jgi:hypothetical protein